MTGSLVFRFQIYAEPIELRFPSNPMLFHPIHSFPKWFTIELAGAPLCLSAFGDEASTFKHLQMLRHRGKTHVLEEGLGEVGYVSFALRQSGEHRAPRRIGERCKGAAKRVSHYHTESLINLLVYNRAIYIIVQ
jgi:hypothetical protein